MSLIKLLKKKYNKLLFTTPSHDGKFFVMHKFYQWYKADISEIETLQPEVELMNAERRATKIYGTKSTKFLTNGSTSGIIAAVLACCNQNDKLLIWSKAHICHKNAAKLAGAEIIEYEMPFDKDWGVHTAILPEQVESLIKKYLPKAIIITSPTYEGFTAKIPEISKICKSNNVHLIVDEAHGALYPFSDKLPQTSIAYADFTVQSLHKTAGGINPTALLHSNSDLDVENALKMIVTTSPSYPMLATIEANINYLNSHKGRKKIEDIVNQIGAIKANLPNLEFGGNDATKILLKTPLLSGYQLSELLYNKFNIEDERTNEKSTLLLTGIGTTEKKLRQLYHRLKKI